MRTDGRNLSLLFDTVEVRCVSTSVLLDNEPGDPDLTTFAEVIAGEDQRWFFTVTALADYADGTLWDLLWETPAYTPIPYTFVPYGNTELASPTEPHFWGDVTVDRKPPVGGDAGGLWRFDARLTCTAVPGRLISGR